MAGRIYSTAAEHLEHHTYKIVAPASYNPNTPFSLLSGPNSLLYSPLDANDRTNRRMSIKYLVDMCVSKVAFTIVENEDVLEIFHMLDAYLYEIKEYVDYGDPDIVAYAKKVLQLRAILYPTFRRVIYKNPVIKEAYTRGTSLGSDLFSVLSRMAGVESMNPIDRLQDPPYQISNLPKVEEQQKDQQMQNNNYDGGSIKTDYGSFDFSRMYG